MGSVELNLFYFLEQSHPLVFLGLLLLLSYTGGKIANIFNAPRVSGYLVIGMLLSPSALGIFHERLVKEELTLITDIALAVIAFLIGGSFGLTKLKRLGKHIFWITGLQALGAVIMTTTILTLSLFLIHDLIAIPGSYRSLFFPMALVIGAISAATAPAATLAILHEYKAKGPLTSILLGVVGLDDGLTIIFSVFAFTIARHLITLESISWLNFVFEIFYPILISLLIGGLAGWILRKLIRFVSQREAMLSIMIGIIFLVSGLAINMDVSPLLANMTLGFIVVNFVDHHDELFTVVENIEEPIFGMFFTLAGAHLDLRVLQIAGWLALLITLGRFTGKLLGSRVGAQISKAPQTVRKYLGLCLLPKAGVTVGLIFEAAAIFESSHLSEIMVNAVLGSVVINELMTPFFVRFAIIKAGEATQT